MPSKPSFKRRRQAAVISLGLLMAAAVVAQQASSQATDNPDTGAAGRPAQPSPAATQTDNPAPRAPEAPIETAGQRPTLDYEPTESISEDKSVSFPVDI